MRGRKSGRVRRGRELGGEQDHWERIALAKQMGSYVLSLWDRQGNRAQALLEPGNLSPKELCLVRPGEYNAGEGPDDDQGDHQDMAHRNAWKAVVLDEVTESGEENPQMREREQVADGGDGMHEEE